MYKILMVDDDKEVLELNRHFFEKNNCTVETCFKAEEAMEIVEKFKPDCILLDIMMPVIDGYALCKKMRRITNVPILFLSGKVSEDDKIKGFECGADDYIEKPYSIREVYVRIISNIRRRMAFVKEKNNNIISIPPLSIDKENHKVTYMGEEIQFSNREFEFLLFFAKRPDEELTFEEIGKGIWGTYTENDKKSIMVNVSRIRKKLLDYTGADNIIETVWAKGYKLVTRK